MLISSPVPRPTSSNLLSSPNALILPFRAGASASYSGAICQYINTQYDQQPDMFRQDLRAIDALRQGALTVREAHVSGITKLQAYAAQIVWIGGKFPIDIGVDFPWYPAFGYHSDRPMVRNNLKYELLNVLYNLAALYCHLADSTSRGTAEGIKTAASYFTQAAGVLSHMRTQILPGLRMSDPPEDMDDVTLEALSQLCLAEAQECSWQKAVTDGYKDGIISKLSIRVSDLYREAAEASMKSNAISSQWIHHMSAKQHHFAAAAQYRMACDCLEKRRYGEEVARLREAMACVNEGLRETKGGQVNKTVTRDLSGLKGRIEEDLKRAEKDNDVIYLQPVPTRIELKPLDRVNMATPKCPQEVSSPCDFLGENTTFGPPLFSKLVPFAVHLAVSIYEERRDRLVTNDIVQPLDRLSETLNATLDSLGLPGSLQALEKPLGLPPSLIQRAEEVRQANGPHRVENSFRDIDELVAADLATFEEGKNILRREEEEDKRMRNTYGEMWIRPSSREDEQGKKLWMQLGEIDSYFKASIPSDKLVRSKYAGIKPQLQLLAGSDRALLDYVPSSRRTDIPEGLRTVLARLRSSYNDVQRLQSRRRKKIDMLREKARSDNVRSAIGREATRLERAYPGIALDAASFDEWLESRLDSMYEAELAALAADEDEQNHVLGELARVHREFESQKRVVGDRGGREREEVLQSLNAAYDKYKEVLENAEAGRKFYNDLGKIVGAHFRDTAKVWANDRRLDAQSLEEEILLPPLIERTHISSPPAQLEQRHSLHHQHTPSASTVPPTPRRDSGLVPEPDMLHEVSMLEGPSFLISQQLESGGPEEAEAAHGQYQQYQPHQDHALQQHHQQQPQQPQQPQPQHQQHQHTELQDATAYHDAAPLSPPIVRPTPSAPASQPQSPTHVFSPQPAVSAAQTSIPPALGPAGAAPGSRRVPSATLWTPDMGINFSSLPQTPTGAPAQGSAGGRLGQQQQDGAAKRRVWDPSAGIRFG
ncbi:hypothetical protein BROUX41_001109 [Berkeleyomyces rouxiae]